MGTMSFQLPPDLAPDAARELERACIAGGPDNMPWPTEVRLEGGRLIVRRSVEESGYLVLPWDVNGAGLLMGATATLMERAAPYHFQMELARGKINQLRTQAADWQAGGLQIPAPLAERIRDVSREFGRAVTQPASEDSARQAQAILAQGYQASDELVLLYVEQMFQVRHLRQPRLDTVLGCSLGPAPLSPAWAQAAAQALNGVSLPLAWKEVEPAEGTYEWAAYDALLDWAIGEGLSVSAGPLIDFSPDRLPDWLWLWERDLSSLASFMSDYVERVVKRYRGKIRSWQLTAASNSAALLGLGEEEFLWLTVRLAEVARQVDPKLDLVVGLAQPWGEYMAVEGRTHSPFIFADTLIRSGLHLGALDLEIVMGVAPRGSYCRDLLETSRLIDLYSLLGVPLRITLGYPSDKAPDEQAGAGYQVVAGRWRSAYSPSAQADWAAAFAGLAACKPSVRAVRWVHLSDAVSHQFTRCGLLDEKDAPKPALARLQEIRDSHLR